MIVMYPTGLAVRADAAPLAPIVVWVVGDANVKSPKMIGRIKGVVCFDGSPFFTSDEGAGA